jgi:DNA-binding XRE family transcriptional regulator
LEGKVKKVEMHERIKELRKKHLKLSREGFGRILGVSSSVINNMERGVLARPDQKLSLVKLMCKEFNVNEDWLLNGTLPMFVEPDQFVLDDYVKQRGLSDLELSILKAYFEIDPVTRQSLLQHFRDRLSNDQAASVPDSIVNLRSDFTTEAAAEADYEKSLGIVRRQGSTVLNTIDGEKIKEA